MSLSAANPQADDRKIRETSTDGPHVPTPLAVSVLFLPSKALSEVLNVI
jgi:hypothetical protein